MEYVGRKGGGAAGKDVYMGESLLVILAVILQA